MPLFESDEEGARRRNLESNEGTIKNADGQKPSRSLFESQDSYEKKTQLRADEIRFRYREGERPSQGVGEDNSEYATRMNRLGQGRPYSGPDILWRMARGAGRLLVPNLMGRVDFTDLAAKALTWFLLIYGIFFYGPSQCSSHKASEGSLAVTSAPSVALTGQPAPQTTYANSADSGNAPAPVVAASDAAATQPAAPPNSDQASIASNANPPTSAAPPPTSPAVTTNSGADPGQLRSLITSSNFSTNWPQNMGAVPGQAINLRIDIQYANAREGDVIQGAFAVKGGGISNCNLVRMSPSGSYWCALTVFGPGQYLLAAGINNVPVMSREIDIPYQQPNERPVPQGRQLWRMPALPQFPTPGAR